MIKHPEWWQTAVQMRRAGVSLGDICRRVGRTHGTVCAAIKELAPELIGEYGRNSLQFPVASKDWQARALALDGKGKTYRQIGAEVGRSYDSVRRFLLGEGGASHAAEMLRNPVQAHVPRIIPPKPDNMAIARKFAAGEIDHPTMAKMLRGDV